jgi:hypothetical protein
VSDLDLRAAAATAHEAATARWRAWNAHIGGSTRRARPWEDYLPGHQSQPQPLSYAEARRRFDAQPRVLAMLAYNSYPRAPHNFEPDELADYQAGESVYVALHGPGELAGGGLITPDERFLHPSSPAVADRLRYLADASRVLRALSSRDQLITVLVAPSI